MTGSVVIGHVRMSRHRAGSNDGAGRGTPDFACFVNDLSVLARKTTERPSARPVVQYA
jgi:hypothetical protein